MRLGLSVLAGAAVLAAFALPQVTWGTAAASLLASSVLALAMRASSASGPALIVTLAGLHFVFSWLINLPEGVLFDVIDPATAVVGLVRTLAASIATVTVMVAAAGRLEPGGSPMSRVGGSIQTVWALLWRLAASPLVFIACYAIAGTIIFPFVREYYEGRAMPEPAAIASMGVLRSLAIVAAAYPLLRTLRTRGQAVLVLAIALPVFGSVAPMLPANDIMPGSIRLVHALETVPYYTLFGALVAVWFGPPREEAAHPAVAA